MDLSWTKEILRWLYPPRCPVCGEIVLRNQNREALICPKCEHGFYQISPPVCYKCGKSIEPEEELCQNCRGKHFLYEKGFPVWLYNQTMQRSLAAFKYHGRREYAIYYGQEFVKMYGKKLKELSVQAFIPVPLYPEKQKMRGYNQAELFAEEIGRKLGIFICKDYLLRVRNTIPQKDLTDNQRYRNLKKAFMINKEKQNYYARLKTVVLVDDIYTTGSTIEICTEVLLRAGIEKVYFATVSIGND